MVTDLGPDLSCATQPVRARSRLGEFVHWGTLCVSAVVGCRSEGHAERAELAAGSGQSG